MLYCVDNACWTFLDKNVCLERSEQLGLWLNSSVDKFRGSQESGRERIEKTQMLKDVTYRCFSIAQFFSVQIIAFCYVLLCCSGSVGSCRTKRRQGRSGHNGRSWFNGKSWSLLSLATVALYLYDQLATVSNGCMLKFICSVVYSNYMSRAAFSLYFVIAKCTTSCAVFL